MIAADQFAYQYQRNTANALSALDTGDIETVKRQIKLAKLASRKKLEAKRERLAAKQIEATQPATMDQTDTVTVCNPTPTETASTLPRFRLPELPDFDFGSPRTQFTVLLMTWSLGSAVITNVLPHKDWHILSSRPPAMAVERISDVAGMPIDGRITSGKGWRVHPVTGVRKWHNGIDISAAIGTPIRATGSGVVTVAQERGACGYALFIDHGTQETKMCHLSRYADGIKAGTEVKKGQIIGYTGNTGSSTGPHLHYEVSNKKQSQIVGVHQYDGYIKKYAQQHGIDHRLVMAVMWKESSGNPNASSGLAHGLMQLTPATGAEVANKLGIKNPDFYDAETSVRLGTAYLAEMLATFGKVELALAAYNAGPNAVRKYNGIPPYPETRNYVTKIVAKYNKLRS